MARETKAGLLLILLLAGVFGFMVYKKSNQPAEAMAQQNEDQSSDGAGDQVPDQSPESDFETASKVKPASASQESRNAGDSPNQPPATASRDVEDPFAEFDAPKAKPKLPTIIPEDEDDAAETVKAAKKPQPTQTVAAKPAEFDPFDEPSNSTAAVQPNSKSAAVDVEDPFDTAERVPAEAPAKRVPAATPVPSIDFAQDGPDPFASGNQKKDPFEAPVKQNQKDSDIKISGQPQVDSDPFEAEVELKAPPATANSKAAAPQEFDEPEFQPQPQSKPAAKPAVELQQGIDDAFDQVPSKPSSVPPLNIPSRDSLPTDTRQTGGDDRFGGFRPANGGTPAAKAFPDERPTMPTASSPEHRRPARPAPVTQIDEDFAPRPASARPLVAGETYQVEPGDNYWTISRKKYGVGRYFMALAQHNAKVITDPKRMKPGVLIATPSPEALEQAYPQLIPQPAPIDPIQTASATPASFPGPAVRPTAETAGGFFVSNDGNPMYRVGSEDTLSGIAQRHLGRSSRWVQIFELNRDTLTDGNSLKIGATLRLPADASRVEVVGGSRTFR